ESERLALTKAQCEGNRPSCAVASLVRLVQDSEESTDLLHRVRLDLLLIETWGLRQRRDCWRGVRGEPPRSARFGPFGAPGGRSQMHCPSLASGRTASPGVRAGCRFGEEARSRPIRQHIEPRECECGTSPVPLAACVLWVAPFDAGRDRRPLVGV